MGDEPADAGADAAADRRAASKLGGKIRPTSSPAPAPTTAAAPTVWALSFSWIFPSASRLTSTSPSTVIVLSFSNCLMPSQSAWAASGSE